MATRKTYISGGKVYNQDDDVTTPRDLQSLELGENIVDATSAVKGLATATQITKLDGITALADVTSATAVIITGAQTKAGKLTMDEGAIIHAPKTYTPAGGATATLNLSLGNNHEITMPAGLLLTSKIHKICHPYFITEGDVSVITEEGVVRLKAPYSGITPAGTKRILYIHKKTVWTTIHRTFKKNIKKIEKEIIAKDFKELNIDVDEKILDNLNNVLRGETICHGEQ